MEKQSLPLAEISGASTSTRPLQANSSKLRLAAGLLLAVAGLSSLASHCCSLDVPPPLPTCASTLAPFGPSVYASRRARLAATLSHEGLAAYVAEPSPNTLYYANLSRSDWHLSERPFLLVTLPKTAKETEATTLIVVPSFEKTRAELQLPLSLDQTSTNRTIWLPWKEGEDPYASLATYISSSSSINIARGQPLTVVVDENVRSGIASDLQASLARQLQQHNVAVISSPPEIRTLRERKTDDEVDRLVCANELTLWAIRNAKADLGFGMTEAAFSLVLDGWFDRAGLGPSAGALVLFGPDAALPHGASGTRKLKPDELVLVDAGGVFQGYTADMTRTFALPGSKIPDEHLRIWSLVHAAQRAAYDAVGPNVTAGSIDAAARNFLASAGYGEAFTHRLGHGIGLEGHEAPYLHPSSPSVLAPGHTFSNEPGVYLEGVVGVRLEDCWVVDEGGRARALTAQQASVWSV